VHPRQRQRVVRLDEGHGARSAAGARSQLVHHSEGGCTGERGLRQQRDLALHDPDGTSSVQLDDLGSVVTCPDSAAGDTLDLIGG
jgi:hypothetical protein